MSIIDAAAPSGQLANPLHVALHLRNAIDPAGGIAPWAVELARTFRRTCAVYDADGTGLVVALQTAWLPGTPVESEGPDGAAVFLLLPGTTWPVTDVAVDGFAGEITDQTQEFACAVLGICELLPWSARFKPGKPSNLEISNLEVPARPPEPLSQIVLSYGASQASPKNNNLGIAQGAVEALRARGRAAPACPEAMPVHCVVRGNPSAGAILAVACKSSQCGACFPRVVAAQAEHYAGVLPAAPELYHWPGATAKELARFRDRWRKANGGERRPDFVSAQGVTIVAGKDAAIADAVVAVSGERAVLLLARALLDVAGPPPKGCRLVTASHAWGMAEAKRRRPASGLQRVRRGNRLPTAADIAQAAPGAAVREEGRMTLYNMGDMPEHQKKRHRQRISNAIVRDLHDAQKRANPGA